MAAAGGDMKPKELHLQSAESFGASGNTGFSDGSNGLAVVDSPDETFSPTSVIFFNEALSCNIRPERLSPTAAPPLRQYEFHIERKRSKSKRRVVNFYNAVTGFIRACPPYAVVSCV